MRPYVIVPIVEGFGEVAAVPILIERWLRYRRFHVNIRVDVAGPVRASGVGALKASHDVQDGLGIEHYVEIALLRRPDAILVLLDADEDCPARRGPALLDRARTMVPPGFPVGVVLAHREYEAWFLAAFHSKVFRDRLAGEGLALSTGATDLSGMDVEAVADCKSRVATLLGLPKYEPNIHQAKLTRILPFSPDVSRRSRSFRKLLKELESLTKQARRRRGGMERDP